VQYVMRINSGIGSVDVISVVREFAMEREIVMTTVVVGCETVNLYSATNVGKWPTDLSDHDGNFKIIHRPQRR